MSEAPKQPNNFDPILGFLGKNMNGSTNGIPTAAKLFNKAPRRTKLLFGIGLLGSALLYKSLNIIPAGNVGIVDTFGKVNEKVLQPGIHLVNPFAKISKVSIKTRKLSSTIQVPSQEGVVIELESSLLYKLDQEKVVEMYKTIGLNYENVSSRGAMNIY